MKTVIVLFGVCMVALAHDGHDHAAHGLSGASNNKSGEMVAKAMIRNYNASYGNISGEVSFIQGADGTVHVHGDITGLPQGMYGFHVHELAIKDGCDSTGPHFNPHGQNHGGQNATVRHVGDLGNVEFDESGHAHVHIMDKLISLQGENSILNRALVLHSGQDDMGMGGDAGSLATGNAGTRAACGDIILQSGANAGAASLAALLLPCLVALLSATL